MNKAILIVICDFLVSAMLTMMTGMVPGHTGGTGVGLDENTTKVLLSELNRRQTELETLRMRLRETLARTPEQEEQLRKITAELAENLAQQSKLRASLAATPENTGILNEEKIRNSLEEEKLKRLRLELELEDARRDLAGSRQQVSKVAGELHEQKRVNAAQSRELSRTRETLSETSRALIKASEANAAAQADLARSESRRISAEAAVEAKGQELTDTRRQLADTNDRLVEETRRHGETSAALASRDTQLRETRQDLNQAKADLRQISMAHGKAQGEISVLQLRVAETSGRLATTEQNFASMKDENTRLSQENLTLRLQTQEAQTTTALLKDTLKDVVHELSDQQQKLAQSQQDNAQMKGTIEALKNTASTAVVTVGETKHEVFERYARAIIRIESKVVEKAFIGNRTGNEVSFYPLVDFGGKTLLVGAFNRFAGDWQKVLDFQNVIKVEMLVSPPFGSSRGHQQMLGGNMLVSKNLTHMAAFPCAAGSFQPLKVVEAGKLYERGTEGLMLFKNTSFESNARLDGRVSLVMDTDKPSLFIRNAGRSNNELNAEPGDIILTSAGEFVGIAAGRERVDGVSGVRVPLIVAADKLWGNTVVTAVPLDKGRGEEFYSRFGSQMRLLRQTIPAGYRRD